MNSSQPIGIFDSGVGGLTVMHAVVQKMPHENIIYFGDTAHLPYGDKSADTIQHRCQKIIRFLLAQHCKCILVACNSASAAAYDFLYPAVSQQALFMSVIEPMIDYLANHYHNQTIGLIGTQQTVQSQIFEKKLAALPNGLTLKSLATPLLVPLIEEQYGVDDEITEAILAGYLHKNTLQGIQALILACTHYPLLKPRIEHFYQQKIPILDAASITADALQAALAAHELSNAQQTLGSQQFYVSDLTAAFVNMANNFFGEPIVLKKLLL